MTEVTETRQGPRSRGRDRALVGLVGVFTEGGPERLPLPHPVQQAVSIGRDGSVALRLDDSQVSRTHAKVEPGQDGVLVTDLGSRNGTFIDGRRVESPGAPAPIRSTLRMGNTLLAVVEDVELFANNPPSSALMLVGGARMAGVRRLVATVGLLPHTVLVLGETGTGKERIAEALHARSGRKGAFVPVNCSAIPDNLVESELFGHVRGAFSGSDRDRTGLFRAAEGGTLFLDEIGDLPLPAQAKLLRALDTGEVRAVGEDKPRRYDVRVVAATNADLEQKVTDQEFRPDLLHRISKWTIELPPLRERREDVPLLSAHFAPDNTPFSVEAMERLVLWRWPGNVRELQNAVESAAARAAADSEPRIEPDALPRHIVRAAPGEAANTETDTDALLRARIETALALANGNVAQVSRGLGFRRRADLYDALKRLGINPATYRKR